MMPNSFSPIFWQLHLQQYFSSMIFCFSSLIRVEDCKVIISLLSNDQIFHNQENLDPQNFLDSGIKSSIYVVTHHNKQPYHQLYKSRWWYVAIRETKTKCFCSHCAPNINLPLLICWVFSDLGFQSSKLLLLNQIPLIIICVSFIFYFIIKLFNFYLYFFKFIFAFIF